MRKKKLPAVNSTRWRNPKRISGEEWLAVPGYKNVKASNYGRIKIHGHGVPAQHIDGRGYLKVRIIDVNVAVSRLVCSSFHENTENKRCVDHINGDRLDNRADNLRWVTHSENSRNPNTRFTQKKTKGVAMYERGRLVSTYGSIRDAAEQTGVPRSTLGKKLVSDGGKCLLGGRIFVEIKNPANIPANPFGASGKKTAVERIQEAFKNLFEPLNRLELLTCALRMRCSTD